VSRLAPGLRSGGSLAVAAGCLLALSGCGSGGNDDPTIGAPRVSTAATTTTCDRQQVPGHEGVDVRVTGLDCAAARAVILAAVGKGRAAYSSGGLSCTPTDAPGGRTDYACTGDGGRRLTFRYGAA